MFAKAERESNRKISAKRTFTIISPQADHHSSNARLAFFPNICYNNYVTLHKTLPPPLCTLTKFKKLCYMV